MGNRYAADEYGVYSAGLRCVCGWWLWYLFVWSIAARWQLVGCAREAGASSAMWSNHYGPHPYVFARSIRSIVGRRPLSNFCSALAPNIDGRGCRLVCETSQCTESRHCGGLDCHFSSCFVLGALHPWAVCNQKPMAVCQRGKVSAYANAGKRRDRRRMEHGIHIGAVLRRLERSHHAP